MTRPRQGAARARRTTPGTAAPADLRTLALHGLLRMFDRDAGLFSFRLRSDGEGIVREGISRRYTAITLIGLAGEAPETGREILGGRSVAEIAAALARTAGSDDSIGDLALAAWAAAATGCRTDALWPQIADRRPDSRTHPTVEVAWALSAATVDRTAPAALREALAERLRAAISPHGLFPHHLPAEIEAGLKAGTTGKGLRAEAGLKAGATGKGREAGTTGKGLTAGTTGRSHVTCFADLVYPVLALAQHAAATGDPASKARALAGAAAMCRLQGADGQWWWHFDYRTGLVLERYPVYAVHQDSMAPMALFAASRAGGGSYDDAIARGLQWLAASPELAGRSLIDRSAGLVWRKVARREPGKLSRYLQAGAARVSPSLRAPGLDTLFPPRTIDFEDRPYHLGWVLFAWPADRAEVWS